MRRRLLLLVITAFASLPLWLRRWIGSFCGFLFSIFPSREKKLARLQIRLILGEERKVRRIFSLIGRSISESVNLTPILRRADQLISCSDPGLIERVGKEGGPMIVLSGHTGNWDLLAAFAQLKGWKLSVVGRKGRTATLQSILHQLRARYGARTLWRGELSGRRIVQALREKQVVAALIDQDTRVKSMHIPFMGFPAKTPCGLLELAIKMRVPVITVFMIRLRDDRFHVELQMLDTSRGVESALYEYNSRLEAIIRRFPEQWVWFHKRWRSPSAETTLSSREYLSFLENKLNEAAA